MGLAGLPYCAATQASTRIEDIAAGAPGAVLSGRSFLWALAADGAAGVPRMTDLLIEELRIFMAFAGMRTLADLRTARWINEPT